MKTKLIYVIGAKIASIMFFLCFLSCSTDQKQSEKHSDYYDVAHSKPMPSLRFNDSMTIDRIFAEYISAADSAPAGMAHVYWDTVVNQMLKSCKYNSNKPQNAEAMVKGLTDAFIHMTALHVGQPACDSLVIGILPIIELKIWWIEKQAKSKEPYRHGVALLEGAEFLRANLVSLRGSYLLHCKGLSYMENTELYDKRLAQEEKKLEKVMLNLKKMGYKDGA